MFHFFKFISDFLLFCFKFSTHFNLLWNHNNFNYWYHHFLI